MSKKHFKDFAREINMSLDKNSPASVAMAEAKADLVAKVSKMHNPRFSIERFREACGLN
jgi:hypothetical protein